ncbi:acyl-CoA dehydrogenase family protein [Actinocrispum wychmicini]|uniref:Alkylation response protein AidB-like acyl-CoA dehydrogenase n=1 Tax=Actinocrispum wychmicini TaxID=1213861 RepID=A0A4R2JQQ2_9PSEU|nr:acyl-CoA dehydrogenase family protein [Actinocrispum wychmicini]TCO59526.1 alkylation response protein AidB-like acyl-CoA dehydrogenase [Actinocrispum wychmicini]
MEARAKNVLNVPGIPSLLEELANGRLPWNVITPFPNQDDTDLHEGDRAVAELSRLLTEQADPEAIERTARIPEDLLAELGKGGWLALARPPESGGRGLSARNVFRVIHAAASWSVPIAQVMAVQAAIGVDALLPVVADGPLRDHLRARVAEGVVSGSADTEPGGAANQGRDTTATPVADGYLLNGEKIHIGNGPVARTLIVSATVPAQTPDGTPTRRLFLVDTDSPGFRLGTTHEFMGLHGFPIAALGFTDVHVPVEHVLREATDTGTRLTPTLLQLVVTGRMYLIAAPSLAIARRCTQWAREFTGPRVIDGRPLAAYDLVQRLIAENLADTFAIDTVARWALHGGPVNPLLEQMAAKNIASVTCWRVLDRTMSLLAGEGFETAASKAARGAPPLPLERAYRDARGFRISGGVDFLLDYWASVMFTLSHYYPEPPEAEPEPDVSWCATTALTARNQEHLAEVARQVHRFSRTVHALSRKHSRAELAGQQARLVALNRVLDDLATCALVLSRAASESGDEPQELADVYCAATRLRLAGHWLAAAEADAPDHAAVTARWLSQDLPGQDLVSGRETSR